MSNAVSVTGILVKRATIAAPTVFTTVGEIVSVSPPGKSRNKVDTTTHNDGAESFILGIVRQKDLSFTINWVGNDATHDTIISDFDGNTLAVWQVAYPSGITLTGNGRVMQFEPVDAPSDAAQQANISIAWAGPITVVTP